MAEATKTSKVYVYDKEGNAYICDIDDLRDAKAVSDEEKASCTDLDAMAFTRRVNLTRLFFVEIIISGDRKKMPKMPKVI
jgi:hypothetical protein